MKRHGFKGQPASHGVSLAHRSMGSVGGGQGSGSRVHPGKKMPGRMGGQFHTIKHLKVLQVDDENGILVVNGGFLSPQTNECLSLQVPSAVRGTRLSRSSTPSSGLSRFAICTCP
jgi:ribosomal protein L3